MIKDFERCFINKIYYIKQKLKKEDVSNYKILYYTINNINKLKDKRIKHLFILGLQNLLNIKSKKLNDRLSYLSVFVYIFIHKK